MNRDRKDVLIELLVIKSQAGNAQALEQLVELLHENLFAYAFRLLGEANTAHDVVQETWLNVMRTLRRLQDPAAFRSWVYRIVHNKSMDYLRTVVRNRDELQEWGRTLPQLESVEQVRENRDLANLRHLIEALPAQDRSLLVLFYDHELSIREISYVTGTTESAIKSRLYHIRQKLKERLSQSERHPHEHE